MGTLLAEAEDADYSLMQLFGKTARNGRAGDGSPIRRLDLLRAPVGLDGPISQTDLMRITVGREARKRDYSAVVRGCVSSSAAI